LPRGVGVNWEPAYRRLIRGEIRGFRPSALRALLWAASLPYGIAVGLRNWAYDRGWLRRTRTAVPVISIGNLTAGGVGKTPFVAVVARWLQAAGRKPVVVSRGYRGGAGANDEAQVLAQLLPDAPHLQQRDRIASLERIRNEKLGDAAVLDDGFQHRRLARDLDLVLIDATDPFGGGLLPRGLGREPPSGLRRAHAVVLTRVSLVSAEVRDAVVRRIRRIAPNVPIAELDFAPTAWKSQTGGERFLADLQGAKVAAFAGIGNPEAFFKTVASTGAKLVDGRAFPDHHRYTDADLDELAAWAKRLEVAAVVATQKDAVKIARADFSGLPFLWLAIGAEFRSGEEILRKLVQSVRPEETGPPKIAY
jgi:tetraacyldisaccharide 4'-kinase